MATKSKKNKDYGRKATNAIITVAASVAVQQGINAIGNMPFMGSDAAIFGVTGGATAVGLGLSVLPQNEMINSLGLGLAAGGANQLTDAALAKAGMSGMGSAASDYLNLYAEADEDMNGIEDLSLGNANELEIA
jgi:hypothetical protein